MPETIKKETKKKESAWIDLIKIILTLGVVLGHASLPDWFHKGFRAYDIIGRCLMGILGVRVPMFFVISGFLFFRGVDRNPKPAWFGKKLKRRIRSLLIPYLIANCVAWCVYAAATKWTPGMISGYLGDDWKDLYFVFWKGPVNLSLWFIRELIVVCLLSPLVWLLIRYTWGVATIAFGVFWLMGGYEPVFFFALGATAPILQLHSKKLEKWQDEHKLNIAPSWRAWCFFVYLYHYLLLISTKKFLVHVLEPKNSAILLAIWIGSTIFTLGILTLVYFTMRKHTPKLYSVVLGGK